MHSSTSTLVHSSIVFSSTSQYFISALDSLEGSKLLVSSPILFTVILFPQEISTYCCPSFCYSLPPGWATPWVLVKRVVATAHEQICLAQITHQRESDEVTRQLSVFGLQSFIIRHDMWRFKVYCNPLASRLFHLQSRAAHDRDDHPGSIMGCQSCALTMISRGLELLSARNLNSTLHFAWFHTTSQQSHLSVMLFVKEKQLKLVLDPMRSGQRGCSESR